MKKTTAGVLAVVLLGAALVWYFNARQPVTSHPSAIELPEPVPTAEPVPDVQYPIEATRPPAEPEQTPEPEPLPALDQSDPEMIAVLSGLLGSEAVAEWLMTEQFINRVVATVDSLTGRQVAPLIMPVRPPGGKFLASGEAEAVTIAPENAARYQAYVDLATAVDTEAWVKAYVRYYPLFQQAYEALGYPGAYFNDRLVEVIEHLLATPEPADEPLLIKPEAVYLYADEDLEALSAGQKMLLRIGAGHRSLLRERLQELHDALSRDELR